MKLEILKGATTIGLILLGAFALYTFNLLMAAPYLAK